MRTITKQLTDMIKQKDKEAREFAVQASNALDCDDLQEFDRLRIRAFECENESFTLTRYLDELKTQEPKIEIECELVVD